MSMSLGEATGFRCPACKSAGLGEIKAFNDDGVSCKVFTCECGHEEVFE